MLFAPPPGYNTNSINDQNTTHLNVPGQQGATALGYQDNPFRSSYLAPSSYAIPSSVNVPNPYYSQPASVPAHNMVRALAGSR